MQKKQLVTAAANNRSRAQHSRPRRGERYRFVAEAPRKKESNLHDCYRRFTSELLLWIIVVGKDVSAGSRPGALELEEV
jgi:hypothetical protein